MGKQKETLSLGDVVMHTTYGRGVIVPAREEEGFITVRFRDGKVKHFNLELVRLRKVSPNGVDEKIKQEEMAQIDYLTRQVKELTSHRDTLWDALQELREKLDTYQNANEAIREKRLHDLRICQGWNELTKAFHQHVLKALGQFPTPIDALVLDGDGWQRLEQMKQDAQRVIDECDRLKHNTLTGSHIIDAEGGEYANAIIER